MASEGAAEATAPPPRASLWDVKCRAGYRHFLVRGFNKGSWRMEPDDALLQLHSRAQHSRLRPLHRDTWQKRHLWPAKAASLPLSAFDFGLSPQSCAPKIALQLTILTGQAISMTQNSCPTSTGKSHSSLARQQAHILRRSSICAPMRAWTRCTGSGTSKPPPSIGKIIQPELPKRTGHAADAPLKST